MIRAQVLKHLSGAREEGATEMLGEERLPMRRLAKERQEKKENSRHVSKRLRAALLRSFRGQHGEKMICMREVPE